MPNKKKLTKSQLKRIARIWCAESLIAQGDTGSADSKILSEEEISFVHDEIYRIADKLRGDEESRHGNIDSIVNYFNKAI